MRIINHELVRNLPLFSEMQDERFDALMRPSFLQNFPAQTQLIGEGDPPDFLFVVVEGGVELFAGWNTHELAMSLVEPGGSFILAAVLKDAVYLMSARTTQRSRILMIPGESVREAFADDDGFSRAIVLEMAAGYRSLVKSLKDLKLRSGVERLAARLVQLNRDSGGTGQFTLPCEKRTLAALLGMTPENLSRAFATLKPYGVEVEGSEIRLTKPIDLERLAKPDPLIDDHTV